MERAEVVSVTSDSKIAKITLLDVADKPGIAARVFEDLARAGINIRLIIQSASSEHQGRITFIPELEFLDGVRVLVRRWEAEGLASRGVIETPGLAARMFAALAREGINIDCISSSEMKVACVIAGDRLDAATRAVHREFFPEDEAAAASA
jgi:aspartate kinase